MADDDSVMYAFKCQAKSSDCVPKQVTPVLADCFVAAKLRLRATFGRMYLMPTTSSVMGVRVEEGNGFTLCVEKSDKRFKRHPFEFVAKETLCVGVLECLGDGAAVAAAAKSSNKKVKIYRGLPVELGDDSSFDVRMSRVGYSVPMLLQKDEVRFYLLNGHVYEIGGLKWWMRSVVATSNQKKYEHVGRVPEDVDDPFCAKFLQEPTCVDFGTSVQQLIDCVDVLQPQLTTMAANVHPLLKYVGTVLCGSKSKFCMDMVGIEAACAVLQYAPEQLFEGPAAAAYSALHTCLKDVRVFKVLTMTNMATAHPALTAAACFRRFARVGGLPVSAADCAYARASRMRFECANYTQATIEERTAYIAKEFDNGVWVFGKDSQFADVVLEGLNGGDVELKDSEQNLVVAIVCAVSYFNAKGSSGSDVDLVQLQHLLHKSVDRTYSVKSLKKIQDEIRNRMSEWAQAQ